MDRGIDKREIDRRLKALDKYTYVMATKLSSVAFPLMLKLRMHISQSEYSGIKAEQNPERQVSGLVDSVRSRPHVFVEFCSAIAEMNYPDLANALRFHQPEEDGAASAVSQPHIPDAEPPSESGRSKPLVRPRITEEQHEDAFFEAFKFITDGVNMDDLIKLEVLIQTVNNNEFYAVMMQLKDKRATKYVAIDNMCGSCSFYFVGEWGKVSVAITQTGMGEGGVYGSWYETKKALHFMPELKYIFAVGVCGGVSTSKVELGQVVVSSRIQGYSNLKLVPGEWINRSPNMQSTEKNFFKFLKLPTSCIDMPEMIPATMPKFGVVLSGPWLVADDEMKQKVLSLSNEAVAFEMEGIGIALACSAHSEVECLVVKGVSDLADVKKSDDWQPQAAINAAKYLCAVMNKATHLFPYQRQS